MCTLQSQACSATASVPAPGGTGAVADGTGANDATATGRNDGTGPAADWTGANDGTGPNDGTGANDATGANDGTWQWEMYGGERRLCLRCGQTEYLRQGVCFNAQCSLAFQKYTAQELGERLLRWGRVLACKQLLFLLYVIGRMCPLKDTPNGSPPKWDYDGGVALYVKCKPSNPLRFPNVDMGFKYSGGLHFGYAFEGAS